METDVTVVKNVKQFVNEFENVKGEKSVQNKNGIEKKSPQKDDQKCILSEFRRVSAIKESLKKHMRQEYIPNRDIPHVGRSLAEVKCDLSKSMELSQEVKLTFPSDSRSLERNVNKMQLTRYNSTDVLSQGKDGTSKRFYPVPAPRQCNLLKSNKAERRYKSNSDLTSTSDHSAPCFNTQYGVTRSNIKEDHLEEIQEVSFSSKLSNNESLINKSSKLLKEDSVFSDPVNDESAINTEERNSKDTINSAGDSKVVSFHKVPDVDGVFYCFRLCRFDWDDIISSLLSDVEETFTANISNEEFQKLLGDSPKMSCDLCCNFNSIVDVLTFKSVGYSVSSSSVSRKHIQNIAKEQLDSVGRQLETSLTSLLNSINNDLVCAAEAERQVLLKVFESNCKLKSKFKSLLRDADNSVNLLFLLNRMLQPCETAKMPSSKQTSIYNKLRDAKEIKTNLDLNCQRLLVKLEPLLPREHFKECLEILTSKLCLSLKRECISFKLMRMTNILKLLEDPILASNNS